jgi:hypothetical protein
MGFGGGGKKGGSAPNYMGAANRMWNQSNQAIGQQTQANRPDQNTAWGSTSWDQDANGNWTQNQSLNPGLQGLMDTAVQRQQQGIDYGGLPGLTDGAAARDQAITSAYGQATSRLDPRFGQAEDQMRTRMYNQGLREGDAAFDQQMANFGRERNDAYTSAMNGAIGQGTQAGSALFNQSLAGRQQMLGEAGQQMNQPMQGLLGLLGGSGALNMPGFMGAGAATPGNYLGAAQSQGQYSTGQQQMNNQMWGSLFGAGGQLGAAALLSDERLKANIVRHTDEVIPGVPRATWTWRESGLRGEGVIAQDVLKVRPDLVVAMGGYLAVRPEVFYAHV